MKVEVGESTIVIGKRVTVGGAMYSISEGLQAAFPEHAMIIGGFTVAAIFIVQVLIGHFCNITTRNKSA